MLHDFSAQLIHKEEVAPNIWQLQFTIQDDIDFTFDPGQYVLLKVDGQYRQYSISSPAPGDYESSDGSASESTGSEESESSSEQDPAQRHEFELIIEYFEGGLASEFFMELNEDENADFRGPAGVFTLQKTETQKIFLATGTGIAPIKSMILTQLKQDDQIPMQLYFGLRSHKETYLYEEFKSLAEEHDNFSFMLCLSRDEVDDQPMTAEGRVNEVLEDYPKDHEYYICGSQQAVESLREHVYGKGVPSENVFFERFT